eukprot:m.247487 g.247487  ORF g.247487 m.247487 type:complete len:64 (+) comp17157_c0_seq57:321-512(+)
MAKVGLLKRDNTSLTRSTHKSEPASPTKCDDDLTETGQPYKLTHLLLSLKPSYFKARLCQIVL